MPNPGAGPYDVAVVDRDPALRIRVTTQLRVEPSASVTALGDAVAAIAANRPTVLIAGPGFANEHGLEQLHRLSMDRPEIGIVLTVPEITTEILQYALRAGVRDVIDLTDDAALRNAVERVGYLAAGLAARTGVAAGPVKKGKLVVSFSTKGGVGKSTVATNISVALARRSERPTCLVDCDLQFGDVAVLLSLPPKSTVVDAAAAIADDDPEFLKNLVIQHPPSGLQVLPAPVEPSAADQVRPEEMVAITQQLQQYCDFVVVDMPPHFDDVVLALIEIADVVLLIASMDIPSIKNLKVGMQTLDLLSIAGDKLRLVLNRANAKVKLDVKEVERALGLPAQYPIPSDIAVPQAVNRGIPVVLDKPGSPAARALEAAADSLMDEFYPPPENDEAADKKRRK